MRVPSANSPRSFEPQQYAKAAIVRPHECVPPALTWTNVSLTSNAVLVSLTNSGAAAMSV